MAKLSKNLKEVISDVVIHTLNTKGGRKSSVTLVAQNVRYIKTIVVKKVTN